MRRTYAMAMALLVLLIGLMGWVHFTWTRTLRDWFESDVRLRAKLVHNAFGDELGNALARGSVPAAKELLIRIARDERVLAAAACTADFRAFGQSETYPRGMDCPAIRPQLRGKNPQSMGFWSEVPIEGSNPVFVSTQQIHKEGRLVGYLVLLHDMSYVGLREATTRELLIGGTVALAILFAASTFGIARFSWSEWTSEIRRMLTGRSQRREFLPLVRDVRELVENLAAERMSESGGRGWTAERLRMTLREHLQGERLVLLANREPYIHKREPDGSVSTMRPASGLVTALEPVMRACSGVWVAHGSGTADRDTADARGIIRVPPHEESYSIRRIWLTPEEEQGYYYGFANEGLWPLCHLAHVRPVFRHEDWAHYRAVNERFAEAACNEVDMDDPIILVHDYHLALAPAFIRKRVPRATILSFWHIPWPNAERFGITPWRNELLEGLLGSSIIGFHTQQHCNNFLDAADAYLESRIDRERHAIVRAGRSSLVRPYPISVEWPPLKYLELPPPDDCRAKLIESMRLSKDAIIAVGVDRMDYTKGIEERLLAVERLLERAPELRGRFTFIQVGAPSRTKIARYQSLGEDVRLLAERINRTLGSDSYRPVILLAEHHEPDAVGRLYRAADLCYVSSLHDGMNLVAKEFVSAREDEAGVLVLSQFTGAARELTEALIVNPYDVEMASSALLAAVHMPAHEQRARMRAMRRLVAEFNVYRWAGKMLVDAATLRRREQFGDSTARAASGTPPFDQEAPAA